MEVALPSWAALRRKRGEAECGCHKKGQCVQGEVTAMLVSNAKSPGHKVGTSVLTRLAVPGARVGKGSKQTKSITTSTSVVMEYREVRTDNMGNMNYLG